MYYYSNSNNNDGNNNNINDNMYYYSSAPHLHAPRGAGEPPRARPRDDARAVLCHVML